MATVAHYNSGCFITIVRAAGFHLQLSCQKNTSACGVFVCRPARSRACDGLCVRGSTKERDARDKGATATLTAPITSRASQATALEQTRQHERRFTSYSGSGHTGSQASQQAGLAGAILSSPTCPCTASSQQGHPCAPCLRTGCRLWQRDGRGWHAHPGVPESPRPC